MADEKNKVPPVTPKSISNERVERGMRSNTGGDPYDRSQNRYAKNQPPREDDEFSMYD